MQATTPKSAFTPLTPFGKNQTGPTDKASGSVEASKNFVFQSYVPQQEDKTEIAATALGKRSATVLTTFPSKPADLCQMDIDTGDKPYQSRHICGPTAVANVLGPLQGINTTAELHALVLRLADTFGMDEKLEYGAGAIEVMAGIRNYYTDHLQQTAPTIAYYGWRAEYDCNKSLYDHKQSIDPLSEQAIAEHIQNADGGWLNIGFYVEEKDENGETVYDRKGGHWVALAGHVGEAGLIIHDPSGRAHAQAERTTQYGISTLSTGRLKDRARSRSAQGFLRLNAPFALPQKPGVNINTAIIDAVIFLKRPEENTAGQQSA